MTAHDDAPTPRLEKTEGEPVKAANSAAPAWTVRAGGADPSDDMALWWSLNRPDGGAHVKVTDDGGRWVITDVYVHGCGLTVSDLQTLPLTQLDLTMNLLGYWDQDQEALMDPSVIAEAVNGLAAAAGYGHAVMHNLDEESAEPSLAALRGLAADAPPDLPRPPEAQRPRLTRPDGTDPDGFAERVAAAYKEYVTKTHKPAMMMAEEAGVPAGTVRGWIREARRRGKLPEGHRGKIG